MFGNVNLEIIPSVNDEGNKIKITGLDLFQLKANLRRLFGKGVKINFTGNTAMRYHIFSIILSRFVWSSASISFEEFFAMEVSMIFSWMYKRFKRSEYIRVVKLLQDLPRMKALNQPELEVPSDAASRLKDLSVDLMDYQSGFLKQYYNATHRVGLEGYIMAFQQGLGKTYTAIATVYAFNLFPCVITAPKSTLLSWQKSINDLIPDKKLREDVIQVGDKFLICNYESLGKLESYIKKTPKSLIVDEIQNFRYMNTARTQAIIDIKEKYHIGNVLALSGTPIKALASEMIPVMNLIDSDFRKSKSVQYIFKHLYSKSPYDAMASAVLGDRLKLYMARKDVSDVVDLPDKKKFTLPLKIKDIKPYTLTNVILQIKQYVKQATEDRSSRDVALSYENFEKAISVLPDDVFNNDLKLAYLNATKKWVKAIADQDPNVEKIREYVLDIESSIKANAPHSYTAILAARKNVTSWSKIIIGRAIGEFIVRAKGRLLTQMVNENMKSFTNIINLSHKKVIIFSTYKEPLQAMSDNLTKLGIKNTLIDSGADFNKRFNSFANDPDQRVILGTIQAIGTGTDGIQRVCNTAIFLNRPFRSTDLEQAEARIFRKGQDSTCYIYYVDVMKDTPNILANEEIINEWSRKMLSIAGVGS